MSRVKIIGNELGTGTVTIESPNTDSDYTMSLPLDTGSIVTTDTVHTSLQVDGWTITVSGGAIYFATGGQNKMKLDASGNLSVTGDMAAFDTI